MEWKGGKNMTHFLKRNNLGGVGEDKPGREGRRR